ncbi:MAG: dipeptide epimerase [Planctomycetota bacterium]
MKLSIHSHQLPLARPFTISRGTLTSQDAVVVRIEHEGCEGLGETTANPYYGHTVDSLIASVEKARPLVEQFEFGRPEELWNRLVETLDGDMFATCAIDVALHDLFGRLQGKKCFEVWGLDGSLICDSSYTIAIDSIDVMVEKLHEQPDWPTYKIKLGKDNDLEMIRRLRQETDAVFRVDANCAWTAEETIEKSQALEALGVEFIEQPLPADAPEDEKVRAYEQSALPLIADESCLVPEDVALCNGKFHGINIKLCKCGGLTPGLAMLKEARFLGMKTMVGCMIESSIGISANAQLLPLLDYADLDGAILLKEDPATGINLKNGTITWSELPGCGSALRNN